MTQEIDLLIVNGVVVTVDDQNRILWDGAVAVQADRIVAVGSSDELTSSFWAGRTIDAHRKLVMPGLVDTYHHAGHGMIKGIQRNGVGWPASPIYFHGSTPDWWYADGLLTAVERVKFGVTTGQTIIGATPARTDDPVFAERSAQAVAEVGTRAFIAVGPPDPVSSHLGKTWSGTFFEGDKAVERPFTYEQTIEVSKEIFRRLKETADGHVQPMLTVPSLCGTNPEYANKEHYHRYTDDEIRLMRDKALEARQIADEFGVLIHTHGTKGVFEWAEASYGAGAVQQILGPDVWFAHMNGLTDHDIRVLQQNGSGISAVPFGAPNTRFGTCPLVKLIQNGVKVAIATDGAAPFHHTDLFIDLHRAMFLQWFENHDMSLLPSGRALRLVTVEAAAIFGMEDEIGSLEPGKKADIILIDLNQPHLVPFEDPANMIAWYVRGNDVDTTIVDGKILMEDGKVLTVDEQAVLDRAREEINKSFERVDVSRYLHHHDNFWQGWRETGHESEG